MTDYYYVVKPQEYLRLKYAFYHLVFAARLAEENDRLFCGYTADQLEEFITAFENNSKMVFPSDQHTSVWPFDQQTSAV